MLALRRFLTTLHDRALYRIWCHPQKGILKHCHSDPFKQHARGLLPMCAACKRPMRKP